MFFRGGVSATMIIAIYWPLILLTINGDQSESRELRPSDHGLQYQNSPPVGGEMRSFFGGSKSSPSTSSDMAMPKAMNSNSTDDTSWWGKGGSHGSGSGRKDHVRDVLLLASVACGITGVALLVASALVYIFKFRRQRSPRGQSPPIQPPLPLALPSSAALSCDHDHDNDNKLQIVVRDS